MQNLSMLLWWTTGLQPSTPPETLFFSENRGWEEKSPLFTHTNWARKNHGTSPWGQKQNSVIGTIEAYLLGLRLALPVRILCLNRPKPAHGGHILQHSVDGIRLHRGVRLFQLLRERVWGSEGVVSNVSSIDCIFFFFHVGARWGASF